VNACLVREEYTTNRHLLLQKTVVDTYQELTPDCESCSMFLKIPIDAVPSFQTAFITVEWKVYFEFLTSPEEPPDSPPTRPEVKDVSASEDGYGRVQQVGDTFREGWREGWREWVIVVVVVVVVVEMENYEDSW